MVRGRARALEERWRALEECWRWDGGAGASKEHYRWDGGIRDLMMGWWSWGLAWQ